MSLSTTLTIPAAATPIRRWSRAVGVPLVSTALTGAALVLGLVALGIPAVLALAIVPGAIAARLDVATGRLPNAWVLATAVTALVAVTAHAGVAGLSAAAAGAATSGGALLVIHLGAPAALGFGDVKFAAALAPLPATAGATSAPFAPLAAAVLATTFALCVASAVAIGFGVVRHRAAVPFGPALVAGAVISAVAAAQGVLVR